MQSVDGVKHLVDQVLVGDIFAVDSPAGAVALQKHLVAAFVGEEELGDGGGVVNDKVDGSFLNLLVIAEDFGDLFHYALMIIVEVMVLLVYAVADYYAKNRDEGDDDGYSSFIFRISFFL